MTMRPPLMNSRNRAIWEIHEEWRFNNVDYKARCRCTECHVARLSAASVGSEYASLSTVDSTAFHDDSSLGPQLNLPDHMLNDDDKSGERLHRSATEDPSQIPSVRMTHKCWDRHLAAVSEVSETERSEGSEPMETFGPQRHSGSQFDNAMSGVWSKVRASLIQTSQIGDPNGFSTPKTVLHQDISHQNAQKTFRVASVDSLLQEFRNEKSRREACGIQREGQNDDLDCGHRVLEAWKRKSEMGFSVE